MSASVPYRAVSAVEELQGIAILMGQRAGKPAEVAVLQLQDAVAELIAFADSALAYVDAAAAAERERHRAHGAPGSQVIAQTVADGFRAALARVKGGAA